MFACLHHISSNPLIFFSPRSVLSTMGPFNICLTSQNTTMKLLGGLSSKKYAMRSTLFPHLFFRDHMPFDTSWVCPESNRELFSKIWSAYNVGLCTLPCGILCFPLFLKGSLLKTPPRILLLAIRGCIAGFCALGDVHFGSHTLWQVCCWIIYRILMSGFEL